MGILQSHCWWPSDTETGEDHPIVTSDFEGGLSAVGEAVL